MFYEMYLDGVYSKMRKHITVKETNLGSLIMSITLQDKNVFDEFKEFLLHKYVYFNNNLYLFYSNVMYGLNDLKIDISLTLLPVKKVIIDHACEIVLLSDDGTTVFTINDNFDVFKNLNTYSLLQYNGKLYDVPNKISNLDHCFTCKKITYADLDSFILKMYLMMYGDKKDEENK